MKGFYQYFWCNYTFKKMASDPNSFFHDLNKFLFM